MQALPDQEQNVAGSAQCTEPARPARLLCAISARDRALFFRQGEEKFAGLAAEVTWIDHPDLMTAALLEQLRPEIILTGWSSRPLPAAWLDADDCPLRYVCHLTGSVKALVPRRFIERGGVVSNWGSLAAETVAEHALLLALAALRNLGSWDRVIRNSRHGSESSQLGTRSLFGRSVGIHGFGAVARALVRLLRPFRPSVRAWSPGVPEAAFRDEAVTPCASLAELFAGSDVIFECESLTPASEGSVDAKALARLPDGAVFVNVARGHIVDEAALVREAESGRIRIALDVVCDEPLSPGSRLYRVNEAVFSPHIGGPTTDQYPRFGEFALRNIGRFLRGREPDGRVTPEIYDRST
ncbi:phosphoglycerate dehydrogenase [Opitutaceae bacterium TAV5]|nr:phosphoglycerate dehydrogenase [Opitutaceae bacterium TAV5]